MEYDNYVMNVLSKFNLVSKQYPIKSDQLKILNDRSIPLSKLNNNKNQKEIETFIESDPNSPREQILRSVIKYFLKNNYLN